MTALVEKALATKLDAQGAARSDLSGSIDIVAAAVESEQPDLLSLLPEVQSFPRLPWFRARVVLLFLSGAVLRGGVLAASPDPVIDVHGWLRDAPPERFHQFETTREHDAGEQHRGNGALNDRGLHRGSRFGSSFAPEPAENCVVI